MVKRTCVKCGAPLEGIVCRFCGTATGEVCDPASEKRALIEFHEALSRLPADKQSEMLAHGFIPSCAPVLLDAGARCAALLSKIEILGAVLARLEAVAARLAAEPDDGSRKAAEDFREQAKRAREQDKSAMLYGCAALLGLIFVLGWAIYKGVQFFRP